MFAISRIISIFLEYSTPDSSEHLHALSPTSFSLLCVQLFCAGLLQVTLSIPGSLSAFFRLMARRVLDHNHRRHFLGVPIAHFRDPANISSCPLLRNAEMRLPVWPFTL